jgi:hypothetical protein
MVFLKRTKITETSLAIQHSGSHWTYEIVSYHKFFNTDPGLTRRVENFSLHKERIAPKEVMNLLAQNLRPNMTKKNKSYFFTICFFPPFPAILNIPEFLFDSKACPAISQSLFKRSH